MPDVFDNALVEKAATNLQDLLRHAMEHTDAQALVVFDEREPLTRLLLAAYRQTLPEARFVDFDASTPEHILAEIDTLSEGDLMIQIQSTGFRLNAFRIRIELFKRGIKAIEHVQLERMKPDQWPTYIDALAYDPSYYRTLGPSIQERVDAAQTVTVMCHGGTTLTFPGGMEPCKLNIGDYRKLPNTGGTFPIGEVITEAKDLYAVNGEAMVFGYAGRDHHVRIDTPFKIIIRDGILTEAPDAPEEFQAVLELIRETEPVLVREFGIGINPAIRKERILDDVTAFERQYGLHLSIGQKHGIYKKPGLNRKRTRYHIDIFIDIETINLDGTLLFEHGSYTA